MTMTIKRFAFMILPLLMVPIVGGSVYSSYYGFDACAARNDKWGREGVCATEKDGTVTCCWWEPDYLNPEPNVEVRYCQNCKVENGRATTDCGPVFTGKTDPGVVVGVP